MHLNKYFVKYAWHMGWGMVFILLTNLFTVYSPVVVKEAVAFLKNAYDVMVAHTATDLQYTESMVWLRDHMWVPLPALDGQAGMLISIALWLGGLYLVVYVMKGVFLFFTRQTIIVMSRRIEFDLKNEVYDQYQRLSPAFYKRNNTGDLMNRISEDVSHVRMYLGPAVMYTLNLAVLVIMVVIVMLAIDVELTLYALLPLPLLSVCIFIVSKKINAKSEERQRLQSEISTMVQENISGIRVVKAYAREEALAARFAAESDRYKMKALDLVKIDALFMPIITLLVGLSTILTIYIGGLKVMAGELGIEHIFQFIFYVNLLTWPFASVGWVTSLVQKAEASQARLNEFIKLQPEIASSPQPRPFDQGKIVFDRVSFTYPDTGITALNEVSFTIEKGQTLAITGRTGSGKSTVANLLMRLYDPARGTITLGGTDLRALDLTALRQLTGYVPQEVFLFSDTIRSNIAFSTGGQAAQTDIEAAARKADIHDSILAFPNGYDTLLGERGINLSGGQKQRLAIARALVRNPHILIFDDCLSAVDTETEEKILSALKEVMAGKTSVIISHRISSIKHADKILVLDHGRIAEQGTHDELLSLGGLYDGFHRKQLLEGAPPG